jgi:hypothetical protein
MSVASETRERRKKTIKYQPGTRSKSVRKAVDSREPTEVMEIGEKRDDTGITK